MHLVVTTKASFGFQVNDGTFFGRNSLECDHPLLVVDPDALDSRLLANRVDDLIDVLFAIEQHAVVRGALDEIANSIGALQDLRHHLISKKTDGDIGVNPEEDYEEEK